MASSGPSAVRISRRVLDRYLLDDETPVVATRQHWAKLVEPFATALLSLLLVASLTATLEGGARDAAPILWWIWFAVVGRAVWKLLEWHNEWFVATDKRLLMVYGLVTHKVAMMPLRKVTDMNYGRSLLGRLLGYGQFVLESAGQDQAMREIRWLPDPDDKYRRICATIFGPGGHDPDEDSRNLDGSTDPFAEHVDEDPFETTFDDDQPSFADRFDPDVVRVPVRERRRPRWEPVERHELPSDWDWVEDEAQRARRATSRRSVAVDPDPTPYR